MELSRKGTCVYCHDTLPASPTVCAGCQATYHSDCLFSELRGTCAVLGCAARHADAPPPPPVDEQPVAPAASAKPEATPSAPPPPAPALLPWTTISAWLGFPLLILSMLALVLFMTIEAPAPGAVALAGVIVGGLLSWLSSAGCPRCQRLFTVSSGASRSLGRRTTSRAEVRDGRTEWVTRTVEDSETDRRCSRCHHAWTERGSRSV